MAGDSLSTPVSAVSSGWSHRPPLMGTRHMAVAGHYGAAHAAFRILEDGGNAVDAGVAAGLALGVLICDLVNIAGVAPTIIFDARERRVHTINGLGTWPKLTDLEVFRRDHGGAIPEGLLRCVVPAAPAAWILALRRFGTLSFGQVASAAIRFAREGFPVHAMLADMIRMNEAAYRRWPSNAAVFLPGGRPPNIGELFVQADLARTLQHMVDEEAAAAKKGRDAGLQAAHDAFYRGDIGAAISRYHSKNGGWLRDGDLAGYEARIEAPVKHSFEGIDVYTCQPWCQGPALLQALSLLDSATLKSQGHNSAAYLHTVIEALKLAFADRERFYGDPAFVDVPLERLLSPQYAAMRRRMIDPAKAWPEMPPAGEAMLSSPKREAREREPQLPRDTSYIGVVDSAGNVFSATPSDPTFDTVMIPGTGLTPSSRGSQSWTDPRHPSCLAPGKRPRLTPSPALAIQPGKWMMPFGTPGGDVQLQAMLQVFLNITVFGMNPQVAAEQPRVASYSFPDSFEPHQYFPGRLHAESRIPDPVTRQLSELGHEVHAWPDWTWRAGAVCSLISDLESGVLTAGADPRRPSYAAGW
jgi:gamma-glutamyltranspeptidase/glutathione hydrolase